MGALAYPSEDAARAAAEVIADAERSRVWVRCLVYAVGRVLWSCAFDKPVMAAETATRAAAGLYTLRAAVRRLREAQTPRERGAAVRHLLEVWPDVDGRLRQAVLLVLRPRHVRPLCRILADALDAAELEVERELAKKDRARAGRL